MEESDKHYFSKAIRIHINRDKSCWLCVLLICHNENMKLYFCAFLSQTRSLSLVMKKNTGKMPINKQFYKFSDSSL